MAEVPRYSLSENPLKIAKRIGSPAFGALLKCPPLQHAVDAKMPNKTVHETNLQVVHEIERALTGIQFGSVEITLHEGRITQIERREKIRLPAEQKPVRHDWPECGSATTKKS